LGGTADKTRVRLKGKKSNNQPEAPGQAHGLKGEPEIKNGPEMGGGAGPRRFNKVVWEGCHWWKEKKHLRP